MYVVNLGLVPYKKFNNIAWVMQYLEGAAFMAVIYLFFFDNEDWSLQGSVVVCMVSIIACRSLIIAIRHMMALESNIQK